jgi:hypothetical protein
VFQFYPTFYHKYISLLCLVIAAKEKGETGPLFILVIIIVVTATVAVALLPFSTYYYRRLERKKGKH